MKNQELINLSKKTTLFLRVAARKKTKKIKTTIKKPFLFYVEGFNGMHPVFIFSSFPCNRYSQGLCSPCLYSNINHSLMKKDDVYSSLVHQSNFIVKNFDKLITNKQNSVIHKNLFFKYPENKLVTMELCGEGSFFSNGEIPTQYRDKIILPIINYAKKKKLNIQLIFETKVVDVLDNIKGFGKKKSEIQDNNYTLLYGFESVNEFSRNIIYNKGLSLKDFEKAISKSKKMGFRNAAFLFCGFHSMTQKEIINDLRNSIKYLRKNNCAIYLMIPNLQPFTINHLLYKYKRYRFLDPRTVLEIIKILVKNSYGTGSSHYFNGYDWSIGGLTTYPQPEIFLFSNSQNITCSKCSKIIKKAVFDLMKTYNNESFFENIKKVDNCQCKKNYDKYISDEENRKTNLNQRTSDNLKFAFLKKEEYINSIS